MKKRITALVLLSAALFTGSAHITGIASEGGNGDLRGPVYAVTFDEGSSKYSLSAPPASRIELAQGKDGQAVRLDGGKEQFVQLDDDITTELDGDYTISVDVYPENEASFARVFDLGTGTDNFAYFTINGGGVPKFRFKGDDLFSDGIFFKLNEWNNAVITKKGGEARLYINGEIAATSNSFVHPLSDLGKTDLNYLGKSHFPNDAYFTGMIDNFMIYDYALDEKTVKTANHVNELQISAGYKRNGKEITRAVFDSTVTSYAAIKNYKDTPVTAKLVTVTFSGSAGFIDNTNISGVFETDTVTVSPGEETVLSDEIQIPSDHARYLDSVSSTAIVKSYIYTGTGGFVKASELFHDGEQADPLPQDTMDTTIGVHDPSIFKDPVSGMYYVYSTGMIDIFKSEDLINWTKMVNTLPELPQCVYDTYKHENKSDYSNIWAPDMFYDESDTETPYHLTCSYSDEFGRNNSSIILFKSASPEGPWENGQIIFSSSSDDAELGKVNAIDSNICVDHKTGKKYMVYGSFWQGIHIKELNDDGTVRNPDTVGTRIMSRYRGIGGPEGGYVIYNEDTGYYYLFTSYDSLSDTYNIRVARSENILGPYADADGNSVDRFDDDDSEAGNTYGYKLMGSWQFPFGTTNYGPGHNSVLCESNSYGIKSWYLVHHLRNVKGGYATLNIRKMYWNDDGWPVVMPERYTGEGYSKHVRGEWDLIETGENTNAMITSKKLILGSDNTLTYGGAKGTWELEDNTLTIRAYGRIIKGKALTAWDSDNARPTVQFSGTDQNNKTVWGKKAPSSIIYR